MAAARQTRCGLCRGELYPGDPYFELEGAAVCEDCLERYARRYFAPRLRRITAGGAKRLDTVLTKGVRKGSNDIME